MMVLFPFCFLFVLALVKLPFPYLSFAFDFLEDEFTGLEALLTMRRGNGDHNGWLADWDSP